jgi:hypothetical protein
VQNKHYSRFAGDSICQNSGHFKDASSFHPHFPSSTWRFCENASSFFILTFLNRLAESGPLGIRTHQGSILGAFGDVPGTHPRHAITIQIGNEIFGSLGNESQKGIIAPSFFVSGGRNAERGMIALRVQDPTARHEEGHHFGTFGDVSAIMRLYLEHPCGSFEEPRSPTITGDRSERGGKIAIPPGDRFPRKAKHLCIWTGHRSAWNLVRF